MFELFYCQDKWPLHLLMWVRIKRLVQGHRASDRVGACLQALNLQLGDDSTTFSPLCLLCSHNKRRRSHFWNTVDRILGYLFNLLQSTHHCRNQKRLVLVGVPCILSCTIWTKCQDFKASALMLVLYLHRVKDWAMAKTKVSKIIASI